MKEPIDYIKHQYLANFIHKDGTFESSLDNSNLNHIVEECNKEEYDSILEIGCRTGLGPFRIAKKYPSKKVLGIDIIDDFIQIARIRGKHLPNLEYRVEDINNMYIKEEFDFVFSIAVLEHTYDPYKAINNIMNITNDRFYHRIDLDPLGMISHYTYNKSPEYWVNIFNQHNPKKLRYTTIANNVIIEGNMI